MTPLISVADLKSLLPIRPANTEFDPRCKTAIEMATAEIEFAVRRTFDRRERLERFTTRQSTRYGIDLYGSSEDGVIAQVETQTFFLEGFPLDTNVPVVLEYNGEVVSPEHYDVDPEHGRITLRLGTRYKYMGLKVTYTAGLTATVIDGYSCLSASLVGDFSPLKVAAQVQALHHWNKLKPENVGKPIDQTDGKSRVPFVVQGGVLPEVASLIQKYRRIAVGRA